MAHLNERVDSPKAYKSHSYPLRLRALQRCLLHAGKGCLHPVRIRRDLEGANKGTRIVCCLFGGNRHETEGRSELLRLVVFLNLVIILGDCITVGSAAKQEGFGS